MNSTPQTPTTPSKKPSVNEDDFLLASSPYHSWPATHDTAQSPKAAGLGAGNDDKTTEDAAILSSPSSAPGRRRWRHKKHFQTIVNHKRYQYGSPMQAATPGSMEADMRRVSIKDSLKNILDNVDTPSLD